MTPVPRWHVVLWLLLASVFQLFDSSAQDLAVRQTGPGDLVLIWTDPGDDFLLQEAMVLGSGAFWRTVSAPKIRTGAEVSVTVNATSGTRFFRLFRMRFTGVASTSPTAGETGVAVTRETIVRFDAPLASSGQISTERFYATFGGRRLLARAELSSDRRTATLFYLEPLPGGARVYVSLLGSGLTDAENQPLDLNGDGAPGGDLEMYFDTLSTTAVPYTAVVGRVFASERDAGTNRPLKGVTITVDGQEQTLRAVTDAEGFFKLEPSPSGRFFVHIDGRTAEGSQWPNGAYYPFVGKAWEAMAGRTNNPAGGSGEIFLPLIAADALQPVSATAATTISFPSSTLAQNPDLADVSITVPPNALFNDSGVRGGRVGLAPVPPDRLPGPLPAGLEMPLVITVQTDGPLNFDRPAPVCFPNVPDRLGNKLAPGSKAALMSFDHDKGDWVRAGSMTVSADGRLICSDPGSGILQPGWHGTLQPDPAVEPGLPPPPPPPPPEPLECGGDFQAADAGDQPEDRCAVCDEDYETDLAICIMNMSQCILEAYQISEDEDIVDNAVDICYEERLECERERNFWKDICDQACAPDCLGDAALHAKAFRQLAQPTLLSSTMINIKARFDAIYDLLAPFRGDGSGVFPRDRVMQGRQLLEEARILAGGDFDTFFRAEWLRMETERVRRRGADGEMREDQPSYPIHMAYEVIEQETFCVGGGVGTPVHQVRTNVVRGMTEPFAQYRIFLRQSRVNVSPAPPCAAQVESFLLRVMFFDPRTKRVGEAFPRRIGGLASGISGFALRPMNLGDPDTDADGLPDLVEKILGTNAQNRDTDGDGISDGAEIDQGLNPGDGSPSIVGIIASASTPGTAKDVTTVGDLAVVAAGPAGVVLFSTPLGQNPTRLVQVDTPGDARSVAAEGNFIAVADGAAGLAVLDVSDPPNARILHQVRFSGETAAVAATLGMAYAGTSGRQIFAVDLQSGATLMQRNTGAPVHDLALSGDRLYVLTSEKLQGYTLAQNGFQLVAEAATSSYPAEGITARKRLFVGGWYAYATSYPGFDVFDLRPPQVIAPLGRATDGGPNSFKQIVLNGSGLGIATVGVNPRDDGTHDLWIYNVKDPQITTDRLNIVPTPGQARAVAIHNAQAYVADGDAGLQIVNYLPADLERNPPRITLSASFSLDPPAAEEGAIAVLSATVEDDVQVRAVEFFIDGRRVSTDYSFPFEHRFITPLLSASKDDFRISARAVDTGGNTADAPSVEVALLPDATPPQATPAFPLPNAYVGTIQSIIVTFTEVMDTNSVTLHSFRLLGPGGDGRLGTEDDREVTGSRPPVITFRENIGILTFDRDIAAGEYMGEVRAPAADLRGNQLDATVRWRFTVLGDTDTDLDGIRDVDELALGLDPQNPDVDGDGIADGVDDLEGDGLGTGFELLVRLDPRSTDSDFDGIRDRDEDSDGDWLTNAREQDFFTRPDRGDTDNDGWNDEAEISGASDPLDPLSLPRVAAVSRPLVRVTSTDTALFQGRSLIVPARPPVRVVVPDASAVLGATVAYPPVRVTIPAIDVSGGTVVARPPVEVKWQGSPSVRLRASGTTLPPSTSGSAPEFLEQHEN